MPVPRHQRPLPASFFAGLNSAACGYCCDLTHNISRENLGLCPYRPSEHFANFGFFDLNQINNLKPNTSEAKWTGPENIGSPESENGPCCCVALDRFKEKSPDFIGT